MSLLCDPQVQPPSDETHATAAQESPTELMPGMIVAISISPEITAGYDADALRDRLQKLDLQRYLAVVVSASMHPMSARPTEPRLELVHLMLIDSSLQPSGIHPLKQNRFSVPIHDRHPLPGAPDRPPLRVSSKTCDTFPFSGLTIQPRYRCQATVARILPPGLEGVWTLDADELQRFSRYVIEDADALLAEHPARGFKMHTQVQQAADEKDANFGDYMVYVDVSLDIKNWGPYASDPAKFFEEREMASAVVEEYLVEKDRAFVERVTKWLMGVEKVRSAMVDTSFRADFGV
ncbi:hypothetical protein FRB99_007584 [Tulasnella sp. 403]|nr:hypothetical protein FRB99_007584 [Tulasnella sp. 403]